MKTSEAIGNIHVVQNQFALVRAGSKRARKHQARYKELAESKYKSRLTPEDRIIPTSKNPGETIRLVEKRFQDGDVVAIFGGDGALNDFVEDRARYGSKELRAARLLVLDLGYACDGAYQFNRKRTLRRPSQILDRAATLEFRPMEWSYSDENGVHNRLANLYGTIGASATAAIQISEETNRAWAGDSFFKKFRIARAAGKAATPISVSINGQNPEQLYDMGIANGSRMAGFAAAFPHPINEPTLSMYKITDTGYLKAGVRMAFGLTEGEDISKPCHLYLPNGADIEFDGEGSHLAPDTSLYVAASTHRVAAFSEFGTH